MARGIRDVTDVTWGVSTTGIAGPTGGTAANPVGTVYIGVSYAGPWGSEESYATVSRYVFDGDRAACGHGRWIRPSRTCLPKSTRGEAGRNAFERLTLSRENYSVVDSPDAAR